MDANAGRLFKNSQPSSGLMYLGKIREGLFNFLWKNEVFSWTHEDMPGINPKEIVHQLNVDLAMKSVK
jgi:hypothetical protein